MRIGVQVPEVERRVGWAEYVAIARAAEVHGLDSLWVGDHLLYDLADETVGPWECWTLLAGLAAVTERVRLGPLVASMSFHNPAMLAKKIATVDEISGGRLVVGLGAGWNEREYAAYGFPFDRRVGRFEEAFTIVRTLLREGSIDHRGRFFQLDRCVLDPPARPGIELMVGSSGPRMLAATVPHVDSWNIWFADYGNDPAKLPAAMESVDEAASAAGRDPDEIDRTAALLVQLGEPERHNARDPIVGEAALREALVALERVGLAEVQLVLDPIAESTVRRAAAVVAELRANGSIPATV